MALLWIPLLIVVLACWLGLSAFMALLAEQE